MPKLPINQLIFVQGRISYHLFTIQDKTSSRLTLLFDYIPCLVRIYFFTREINLKKIIIAALTFVSIEVFAGSEITLTPGTSVEVNSGEQTTVNCNDSTIKKNSFCTCGGSGVPGNDFHVGPKTLVRYDIVGEVKLATIVQHYSDRAMCENTGLISHPSCK